jgi:ABC-type nitrate/sulfonate/bicarbonate transport system permease component
MSRLPGWVNTLIGIVAIVVVWWIAALVVPGNGDYRPVPTPVAVLQTLVEDGFGFYWTAFSVTLAEAGIGYFWGNLIALLLSGLVLVVPKLEGVLNLLAVITY